MTPPRRRRVNQRVASDGVILAGTGIRARIATGRALAQTPLPPPPPTGDPLGEVYDAMPEREFQAHVEQALTDRGYLWWHVRDSRLMAAGLPDLIAVHPTRVPRRVVFFELKTARGRVSRKQAEALAALGDVYGVWAAVIRPADWRAVVEDL